MADSFVSRFGCYTIIWDTTPATSGRPTSQRSHALRQGQPLALPGGIGSPGLPA